jgi:hypothetical protein
MPIFYKSTRRGAVAEEIGAMQGKHPCVTILFNPANTADCSMLSVIFSD